MRAIASVAFHVVLPALMLAGCGEKATEKNMAEANTAVPNAMGEMPGNSATPMPQMGAQYGVYRDDKGRAAPDAEFVGPGGAKVSLKSFVGKPFLLVLWGTDYAQSTDMLPSLDAFAAEGKLPVVAVNVEPRSDDAMPDTVTPFLKAHQFKALQDYRDRYQTLLPMLHGPTIPDAILYNSAGHEVLRISGTADFTSPEVRALLAEAK